MRDVEIKTDSRGRRYVRPFLGVGPDGRVVRPYHSIPEGLSDEEARQDVEAWMARIRPASVLGSTTRMGRLLELFVQTLAHEGSPANTVRTYDGCARRARPLWPMDACEVSTADVQALYTQMTLSGLAAKTVILEHSFLGAFFSRMSSLGLRPDNPVHGARPPRPAAREAVAVTGSELARLDCALREAASADVAGPRLRSSRASALGSWLALNTGLREGEVCGLRRRDLYDAADGRATLRVAGTVVLSPHGLIRQQATKGRRVRHVALAAEDASFLREATSAADGLPDAPLVTASGSWADPTTMARWLRRFARELGMPEGFTFHSLRHSHATQLLTAGVDVKTVSERLGHADVATTLRIYGHVLPGRDGEAADAFARSKGGEAA